MSDRAWILLLGIGAFAALRTQVWWNSPAKVAHRRAGKARRSTVSDARDGELVRLSGRILPRVDPLTAPLSGRTCLFYSSHLYRFPQKANNAPELVLRFARGVDFHVEDDTGRALVRGDTVRVFRPSVYRPNYGELVRPTEPIVRLEQASGRTCPAEWFPAYFQMEELILPSVPRAEIVGVARWEMDPEGGGGHYREAPRRLVLEPLEKDFVVVYGE